MQLIFDIEKIEDCRTLTFPPDIL